ncbi:MAG: hypothetical protein NZ455_16620 [Bacteroidia bacterium]|nr:hypothetical protein [Bacteroidia bacterium]MDW8348586.1 hypothetical protein [Bacteroidia bacterium]
MRAHKYYEPRTNDYVDTLTGVKIIWQEIQFPTKWLYGPISATYSFIEEREKNRFVPIILKAMRKYPAAVLKKNLKRIYLVGYLSFYGVKFGGTNSNDCLYLCNEGSHRGYTDFYLEQIFHHEFSSILLRNYPQYFQKEEWIKYTKHEFQEGATGVDAIKNGTNKTEFDEELCHKGILYQYALSTLENDFNSYAENIFCPTKEFWKVVEQYPNVRQKLYLIIDFYHEINKEFDMNYFLRFKHGYFD